MIFKVAQRYTAKGFERAAIKAAHARQEGDRALELYWIARYMSLVKNTYPMIFYWVGLQKLYSYIEGDEEK